MKHETTRALYAYWSSLRRGRTAPGRHEIDPADMRRILADTFILEAAGRDTYSFRLAGTRLCGLHCAELKGRNFLDLWTGRDREAIASLVLAVAEDGAAAVFGVDADAGRGNTVKAEILLLPLTYESPSAAGPAYPRLVGSYAALGDPYWSGIHPVIRQPVTSLRLIWPDETPAFLRPGPAPLADPAPALAFPAVAAEAAQRRVGHLVVYEGGRN